MSAAWLGCSPVGRSRDSYRAEDLSDHVRHIVEAHGLPAIWRFERGPWECSFIDGIELADGTRWGGLGGICKVVHTFKSRGKGGIESGFNLLQDLIAHAGASIGRTRGEFEAATKLYLRAGRGDDRAVSAFWDIAQAADGLAAAMRRFNARPKERRALAHLGAVSPDDLRRDARKRECPAGERWRLLPIKRQATVRGGCVETSVNHYPLSFRFRVNGVETSRHFDRGYQVLIAFHPGAPEEGCWLFNGEPTGSSRNRDGMKLGEFLMLAPMAEDAPQVNLAPEDREFLARKNANAAVRSEFRAITSAGKVGRSVSSARDGWGNKAERGRDLRPTTRSERQTRADEKILEAERRHRGSWHEEIDLDELERLEEEAKFTRYPAFKP